MTLIQMMDGKQFLVKQTPDEVMDRLSATSQRGRGRPMRPGEVAGQTFVSFVTDEKATVILNIAAIAFVTEEAK